MANRAKRTENLDDHFVDAIAEGRTVSAACGLAGYSRRVVYEWRAADAAFRERWDEAVAIAIDRLEAEADRRAVEGTLEPVFYQGEECGQVRKYSDVLLSWRFHVVGFIKLLSTCTHQPQIWRLPTGIGWKIPFCGQIS